MHLAVRHRGIVIGLCAIFMHIHCISLTVLVKLGGLWFCTMEMGTRGKKKVWRKGYEITVTQFVSVFMVESEGAALVTGEL